VSGYMVEDEPGPEEGLVAFNDGQAEAENRIESRSEYLFTGTTK
jgi:hypothetical protein